MKGYGATSLLQYASPQYIGYCTVLLVNACDGAGKTNSGSVAALLGHLGVTSSNNSPARLVNATRQSCRHLVSSVNQCLHGVVHHSAPALPDVFVDGPESRFFQHRCILGTRTPRSVWYLSDVVARNKTHTLVVKAA